MKSTLNSKARNRLQPQIKYRHSACSRQQRFRKKCDDNQSQNDQGHSRSKFQLPSQSPNMYGKRQLKPDKYSGETSFERLSVQFSNCASYNGWNDLDKSAILQWCLTGAAQQILWDSGISNTTTYDEIMRHLEQRFGSKGQEEKYQLQLRLRRRQQGESLQSLYTDIRRLMALSYPDERSQLSEIIAKDAFLTALDDYSFEVRCREREPKDLDTALYIALRLEQHCIAAESSEYYRRGLQFTDDKYQHCDAQTDPIKHENTKENSNVNAQLQQQENKRQNVIYHPQHSYQPTKTYDWRQTEELHEGDMPTTVTTNENSTMPKGPLPIGYHQNRQYKENGQAYFRHRQPGHTVRNFVPRIHTNKHSNVIHKAERNFVNSPVRNRVLKTQSDEGRVYIRASVKNVGFDCLLDTGSEVTIFPSYIVKKDFIQPTTQRMNAANGTSIELLGEANVQFDFSGKKIRVFGLVSERVADIMLGQDFLTANNAVWNFSSGKLLMHRKEFPLYALDAPKTNTWSRRVIVSENTVVPAWSEIRIPAKQMFRNLRTMEETHSGVWMTETNTMKNGLKLARVVVNGENDVIPMRIINSGKEPVRLCRGTVLANLSEAVEVMKMDSVEIRNGEKHVQQILDAVAPEISDTTKDELSDLLVEYADIFSQSEYDLGHTHLAEHRINTGEHQAVRQPLRRQPPLYQQVIKEQTEQMLSAGVIEPSESEWASNVVLVKKKDGKMRFCIDYRQVNNATKKDSFPLPRIDQCLDTLNGSKFFSTFDLTSGYHQVGMANESADKTAFVTRDGLFQFRKMPFGLTNAGASFQRLMTKVLQGINFTTCLAYLDDIILFSTTEEQHMERLRQLFGRIRIAGLKFKPSKCHVLQTSIHFLGYVVNRDGIQTESEKVKAVQDWPIPRNVHELRAYLGLASYYRRFIQSFAHIAAPLHRLTGAHVKFEWDKSCQIAFDSLKEKLTSAPILVLPNDDDTFILDTDASNLAMGAVLSQLIDNEEKVVAYASRTFNRAEQNYCTTRRELLAVVYFTGYFKQYLLGRSFKIRSDHAALQWLRKTPNPVGQEARWLEKLEEYDFTLSHRSGKLHGNADSLSRRPCRKTCCQPAEEQQQQGLRDIIQTRRTSTDLPIPTQWAKEDIAEAQKCDSHLRLIYAFLEKGVVKPTREEIALESAETKTYWYQWSVLAVRSGLLCRKFTDATGKTWWQIILPHIFRKEFIQTVHGKGVCEHLGVSRTTAKLQELAYWCNFNQDIQNELRRCNACSQFRRGKMAKQVNMRSYLAGEPWERISIDITGPFPRSSRMNVYALTLIDHFTKYAMAFPIRDHTATTVVKILISKVFTHFGFPYQLQADNGPEFNSLIFEELHRIGQCTKLRTSPYHPASNGNIERLHRTMNSLIGKTVNSAHRDWDFWLPHLMCAYNSTRHDTTGFSPNRLMFNREIRMPIDLVLSDREDVKQWMSYDDFVSDQQDIIQRTYQIVRDNIKKCAERRKDRYNLDVRPTEYHIGDWVWRFYPRRFVGRSSKWQKRWEGPHLIVAVISESNLLIQKSQRSPRIIVHIDHVKAYSGPPLKSWLPLGSNDIDLQKFTTNDDSVSLTAETTQNKSTEDSDQSPLSA